MELRTYLALIRRSWALLLITLLLGAGAGLVAFFVTPETYASRVQFYVSTPNVGNSPQAAGQFAQARVNSYIILLTSEQLGRRVVNTTGVALPPAEVASRISATSELNTVVIGVTVTDGSAARAVQIAQGVVDNFGEMVDDLDNQGRTSDLVSINTISGPTQPTSPISPELWLYLGAGLAGGLLAGLAFVVIRELADTSVRTEETAQQVVQAPVIGTIPFDPDTRQAPLIVGETAGSVRAEAYRQLRTNLQFIGAARAAQVVLVTSAQPMEGKTLTSVNLALTFVEFGDRVLLIEADLRRPKLAEALDLTRALGLTNVLAGQVELDEVIQPWGHDGLSFLASGSTPPNPSELLGSEQMRQVMTTLRGRFDRIIIDTTPVLPVTDGVVASSLADAVVFVIKHGSTSRSEVEHAARTLEQVDARVVGSVLNMERQSRRTGPWSGSRSYYGPTVTETPPFVPSASNARSDPAPAPAEGDGPARLNNDPPGTNGSSVPSRGASPASERTPST